MSDDALSTALSVARLSLKYQMDDMYRDAMEVLEYFFPTTLKAWDDVDEELNGTFTYSLEVASFAYERDIRKLLPSSCFAALCHHDLKTLVSKDLQKPFLSFLVQGLEPLIDLSPKTTFSWLASVVAGTYEDKCPRNRPDTEPCIDALRRGVYNFLVADISERIHELLAPFDCLVGESDFDALCGDLCPTCRSWVMKEHQTGRQKAWETLPQIFGLDGWPASTDTSQT